jgi:hypothetical protein
MFAILLPELVQAQPAPTNERVIQLLLRDPPLIPPGWGIAGNGSWLSNSGKYVDPLKPGASNVSDHDMRLMAPRSGPGAGKTPKEIADLYNKVRMNLQTRIVNEFGSGPQGQQILNQTTLYPPEQLMDGVATKAEAVQRMNQYGIKPNLGNKPVEGVYSEGTLGFVRGQEATHGRLFYQAANKKMASGFADILSDKVAGAPDVVRNSVHKAADVSRSITGKALDAMDENNVRELFKHLRRAENALLRAEGMNALPGSTTANYKRLASEFENAKNMTPELKAQALQHIRLLRVKATLLEKLKYGSPKDKELIIGMLNELNNAGAVGSKFMQAFSKLPLEQIGKAVGVALTVYTVYTIYSEISAGKYDKAGRSAGIFATFKYAGLGPGLLAVIANAMIEEGIGIGTGFYDHFMKSMVMSQDSLDLLEGIFTRSGIDENIRRYTIDDLVLEVQDPGQLARFIEHRVQMAVNRGFGPKTQGMSDAQLIPYLTAKALEEIGTLWAMRRTELADILAHRYLEVHDALLALQISPTPAEFRANDAIKRVNVRLRMPTLDPAKHLAESTWKHDLDRLCGAGNYHFWVSIDWTLNGERVYVPSIPDKLGFSFSVEESREYEIQARIRLEFHETGRWFGVALAPLEKIVSATIPVTVGETPALAIIPPPDIAIGAGAAKTPYVFTVVAQHIPDEADYRWLLDHRTVGTGDTVTVSFPADGAYKMETVARWRDGRGPMEIRDCLNIRLGSGAHLEIIPPPDILAGEGQPEVPYLFATLPTGIPPESVFHWAVNGGSQGTGDYLLRSFPQDGDYLVEVTAKWGGEEAGDEDATIASTPEQSVTAMLSVKIGLPREAQEMDPPEEEVPELEERDFAIDACDKWMAAKSGGVGVTIDTWDISALPANARFDISFNAYSVPDKFVVEYPSGSEMLDTGWRGVQSYVDAKPELYPGGLSGGGSGRASAIFTRGSADAFTVTVNGPEADTAWDYQVRARCSEEEEEEEEGRFVLSGVPARPFYGSTTNLRVTGGKGKVVKYTWQASPELTFSETETASTSTQVTFSRMDDVRLWVDVEVENDKGGTRTVSTEMAEALVIAPSFTLEYTPAPGQARPGDIVHVSIESQPAVPDELIDFRWIEPPSSQYMVQTENASAISITAGENDIPLHVWARVPVYGDSIAEIQGSFSLSAYVVSIGEPIHRGPPPQIWDANAGGLVDAPRGSIMTHQQVTLEASVTPPPRREIRYAWSVVPSGGRTFGTIGRSQTFSAHEAGTYQVTVEARTDDGTLLGRGMRAVTVIEEQVPVKDVITLELVDREVLTGQLIAVKHSEIKNLGRHAWIGFYESSAARDQDYLHYTFLRNLRDRTYDVIAPAKSGREYHFRLFLTEDYEAAAASESVVVK